MKCTRDVTGAVLLVAFATVGCSNKRDTSPVTTALPAASLEKPAPTSSESQSARPSSGEAASATVTPAIVPSFSDGEAAYRAKKYEEAMTIFDAYVSRRPHNAWGHYMLALSAWKHGDLAKSEQAFARALSIDPGHIKSHVNLSRVLVDLNRHAEAIEQLTHAADIDPESREVHRLLGRTYHALGKTDEAVQAYQRALEVNERDAWSLNDLALVLIDANRPDEALALLIQAVELRKDVAEFHNNLGLALEHGGHLSAAVAAYGTALRVDPGYDKAKQNLARVDPQE
jgi:tetratricopeptide (TPR) repeat protein